MPMVLITNDTNHWTWYRGKKGELFPVSYIKDSHYFVADDDGDGMGVHSSDGELLYTEAEYNAIRGQLDQASEHKRFAESVANQKINECNKLRRQHDKAIDDLARHAKELAGLRQERQMLLEAIEKAAGEQPLMELPRDVVDALQSFFDDGYDVDHIVKCLLRISSGHSFPRLESIREYAAAHGYEFICALANGYTAEKTPEERLRAKVEELLYKWLDSPVDDAGAEEISQLAGQIVEHAKEITT